MAEKEVKLDPTRKYIQELAWGKHVNLHEDKKDNQAGQKNLLKISEISLILDNYDDIFSDFDPRPYPERALSDDFLIEAKKASRDVKSIGLSLKLMIPRKEENNEKERMIKKRLKEHFKHHAEMTRQEIKDTIKKGVLMALLGSLMLIVASYFSTLAGRFVTQEFLLNLVYTLLEPAGWFIAWYGLDEIFYKSAQKKPDKYFYDKMEICDIVFVEY